MDRPARGQRAPATLKVTIIVGVLGFVLCGCVETTASLPPQADTQSRPTRQESVASPRRASVALASLSGMPRDVADRMSLAFAQEAGAHDIPLAAPEKADYLVRGYVNAYPTDLGTSIAFVFDIFDAGKKRAQRLGDILFVRGTAADPSSLIDSAAMTKVFAKSAGDLATFLGNGPSAPTAAEIAPADAVADADEGRTIVERTVPPATPPASPPNPSGLGVATLR